MANLLAEFKSLLPGAPLLVGDVTAVSGNLATIELPGGATLTARGSAAVGQRVFVRDGTIEGQAPALEVVLIEI
jgi:hypothetical protein